MAAETIWQLRDIHTRVKQTGHGPIMMGCTLRIADIIQWCESLFFFKVAAISMKPTAHIFNLENRNQEVILLVYSKCVS